MTETTTKRHAVGRLLDRDVMRRRQRDYLDAIKPFTDAKVEIYAITTPTIVIYPDGQVERRYNFTPDQLEALRRADELIDAVNARIFGA